MQRIKRSLGELSIPMTFSVDGMFCNLMELIKKNGVRSGFLYLHVTRGSGDRAFHYHDQFTPNVFAFTQGEKFKHCVLCAINLILIFIFDATFSCFTTLQLVLNI